MEAEIEGEMEAEIEGEIEADDGAEAVETEGADAGADAGAADGAAEPDLRCWWMMETILEFVCSVCCCWCCCTGDPTPIIDNPVSERVLPGGRAYTRRPPKDYEWTNPRHNKNTGAFDLTPERIDMATLPYTVPGRIVMSDADFDLDAELEKCMAARR